jgi:FtsH-binding integral membrane protein
MTTACSASPDEDELQMRSPAARTFSLMIGGLAVLVGGVWIGQGAGFIKGSFMTGSPTWLAIGLLCLVVGLFLIFLTLRRGPGGGGADSGP